MARLDRTARTANLAVTATTLVALAAIAAGAPSLRGLEAARAVETEVLASLGETPAVRAVAAAVAAAARDLLRGKPTPVALPAITLVGEITDTTALPVVRPVAVVRANAAERIGLRRLDLPPPVC